MAKQSRGIYITGDPVLDMILGRIVERLDVLEGIRPDLDAGVLSINNSKEIDTDESIIFYKWDGQDDYLVPATGRASLGLGTMALQNAAAVTITGGTINNLAISNGTIAGSAISGGSVTGSALSGGTANDVDITEGSFQDILMIMVDSNETILHEFPLSFLSSICEWFMFL